MFLGESIQIFAEIENCSSRVVVPKAAIYQTQTFYAKGKVKEIKQLIANLRGDPLPSGKTDTWNGKMLKIPPVSPSILDCSIIRVEYSLMVSLLFQNSRVEGGGGVGERRGARVGVVGGTFLYWNSP